MLSQWRNREVTKRLQLTPNFQEKWYKCSTKVLRKTITMFIKIVIYVEYEECCKILKCHIIFPRNQYGI